MMIEQQGYQIKMNNVTIADLVPKSHLLRKIARIVKWDFIGSDLHFEIAWISQAVQRQRYENEAPQNFV